MNNIVFSGDLYIKYYPTRVSELVFDNDVENHAEEISNVDLDENEIANAIADFMLNFDQIIEENNPKSIMSYDYSKNSGFYFLSFDNKEYKLTSEKHLINGLFTDEDGNMFEQQINDYCLFDSMDELNEHFVSLSDFLLNAKSVGFVLEPLKDNLDKLFVLCEYKDTYLVINSDGEYDVISKHHPYISNYTFGGDLYEDFDKKKIYLEIFKQKFNKGIVR